MNNEKAKFRASKEWKNFRQEILVEREYTCELCGGKYRGATKSKLHVHHRCLDANKYQDISDKSNFSLLCKSCHDFSHFCEARSRAKGNPSKEEIVLKVVEKSFRK